MDELKLERRKRVADAMEDVVEIAKINGVGPVSFAGLLVTMAAALFRAHGCPKEVFLKAAADGYDRGSGAVKIDPPKH